MTNIIEHRVPDSDRTEPATIARSHRITTAAWLAGVSAVVGFAAVNSGDMTIGAGLGAIGISGMVATVCYFILRDR